MKVIKNINNNIALCLDSKGREVIAFGKGIGFIKPPHEIPLSQINRTFYNVKDNDYGSLRKIPTEIINVAIEIVDMVSNDLDVDLNSFAALSLADHINFAIERYDQHIYLEMPLQEDIKQLYPNEMKEAYKALDMINAIAKQKLPKSEAGTLALHFVNNKTKEKETSINTSEIAEKCTEIIEKELSLKIDRNTFSYSRFITHIDYLVRRSINMQQIETRNKDLFKGIIKEYPSIYSCTKKIEEYMKNTVDFNLNDEEILYLMLHINRLYQREEI